MGSETCIHKNGFQPLADVIENTGISKVQMNVSCCDGYAFELDREKCEKYIHKNRFQALEVEDEEEQRSICQVGGGADRWVKIKQGEVTIDSAAEESVCPVDWCEEYEVIPKKGKGLRLITANGGEMRHYGSRKPTFQPKASSKKNQTVDMEFQVSE